MSEHFTHIAVYEDTVRMILTSNEFCETFKKSLQTFYDSGLLGSSSRGNHLFAVPILELYKNKQFTPKDNALQKIAYAIGWLTHRASDHQMKPVLRATDALDHEKFNAYVNSIYHDVMSFRQIYQSGKMPSLSNKEVLSPATFAYDMENHPAASAVDVPVAESFFNRMWQKDLLNNYVFLDKQDDFDAWLDRVMDVYPDFSENFHDYERVFNDPDADETAKYWHQDNLYDKDDLIIQYVRQVQAGKTSDIDLADALQQAEKGSLYAQALLKSYRYVQAASDYFSGNLSKTELYDAVHISDQFRF